MLNDKEKLIELLKKNLFDDYDFEDLAEELIANGVTVQKKGKWIDHACSCCGKVNPTLDMNGWGDYVSKNTNYCGNCGADMRGDKSEND